MLIARGQPLAALLLALLPAAPALADEGRDGAAGDAAEATRRPVHLDMGIGGFVAFTGPASAGLAVELAIYPGLCPGVWPGCSRQHSLSRTGLGLVYRTTGDTIGDALMAAGLTFEAGSARPLLTLSLHGELGYDTTTSLPVLGGGLRAQSSPLPPLALAINVTGHLYMDGIHSRLALATSLTVGLSW